MEVCAKILVPVVIFKQTSKMLSVPCKLCYILAYFDNKADENYNKF